jgi:hypothetical protein
MSQGITVRSLAEMVSGSLHETLQQAPAGHPRPVASRHHQQAAASIPIQFFLMADQAAHLRASAAPEVPSLRAGRLLTASTLRVCGHLSRRCGEHGGRP